MTFISPTPLNPCPFLHKPICLIKTTHIITKFTPNIFQVPATLPQTPTIIPLHLTKIETKISPTKALNQPPRHQPLLQPTLTNTTLTLLLLIPQTPKKNTPNNPPKLPDYKIPSFFIPKIEQVNPKQFISHLAHLPIFSSNSGPTFKIHIAKLELFVITPFTQTGANFLKTPILFPHNNKSIFVSLNPITNNIPLHKFIIKNIPNHLNTSHFSHMPHLFKCHPLAQPNTANTNINYSFLKLHPPLFNHTIMLSPSTNISLNLIAVQIAKNLITKNINVLKLFPLVFFVQNLTSQTSVILPKPKVKV